MLQSLLDCGTQARNKRTVKFDQRTAATAINCSCRHFPPLFLSGRATAHPPRSTRGMQRGATWGIVGIIPDECLQTPRFASTGFIVTVGAGRGLRRHRGRRARASPTTRASRAGVAIMNDGIGTRRVILPLGACRFSRYIPIGNAHLGRRSRYQPLPGSGPRS